MNTLKELAQKETYYAGLFRLVDNILTQVDNKQLSVKSALEMLNGYCDDFSKKMYTKKHLEILRTDMRLKFIEARNAYTQAG